MATTVQHIRGTRAALNALRTAGSLLPGMIYVITDEAGRIAMATAANAYTTYVQGDTRVTVGNTAPSSPSVGDIWVDTTV